MGDHQVEAFALVQRLREQGVRADLNHTGHSLKAQFKYANKVGTPITATLGDDEAAQGVIKLKNMQTREEQTVPMADMAQAVRAMLEG